MTNAVEIFQFPKFDIRWLHTLALAKHSVSNGLRAKLLAAGKRMGNTPFASDRCDDPVGADGIQAHIAVADVHAFMVTRLKRDDDLFDPIGRLGRAQDPVGDLRSGDVEVDMTMPFV